MIETLVIQVTNRCGYNCPQCYVRLGNENLQLDIAKSLIAESFDNGLKAVQLTGGEPIVYPYLSELIEYAHGKGLYVFLATSGHNHSESLYRSLKDSGLDVLCVSINDIDESINKLTRSVYEESFMAIRDCREAELTCFANVVLSDDNVENLSVLAEYLQGIGVERIDILRPVRSFDGKYIPSVSGRTLQLLDETVKQDADFFRVENCFKEYWEYIGREPFTCRDVGSKAVFLNADGTFSPCSKLQSFKYSSVIEMMKKNNEWKGGCYR